MRLPGGFHLTYCSNIHPGESWPEVRANLERHLPLIKQAISPHAPFGVGLRLSAQAAQALEEGAALEEFASFLESHGCYVFTLNGFPYGVFHGARVKEEVYLPDWLDDERLSYTNRLARILARVLPEDIEGTISTVPGAFKNSIRSPDDEARMARRMLSHVAMLHRLRESHGKTMALAIEPEPCCHIETTEEAIAFFKGHLFSSARLDELAMELGTTRSRAEEAARRHLGLCLDACHQAVEFEDMAKSLAALNAAGVAIRKVQVSSALKLRFQRGDGRPETLLRPFAESTYLHQVVERAAGGFVRHADLPQALDGEAHRRGGDAVEWRVHFHVPVFLEEMREFETTQTHLVELLALIKKHAACPYLEVETYTWDVLPPEYRTLSLDEAIVRELEWVRGRLAQ